MFFLLISFLLYFAANERVALDLKENGGTPEYIPDGMTIDEEGNLYVATWGGSKILKVDPKYV